MLFPFENINSSLNYCGFMGLRLYLISCNPFSYPHAFVPQRQDNQIPAPRIDNAFPGRADRVPPVDLPSTVVEQRVVQGKG